MSAAKTDASNTVTESLAQLKTHTALSDDFWREIRNPSGMLHNVLSRNYEAFAPHAKTYEALDTIANIADSGLALTKLADDFEMPCGGRIYIVGSDNLVKLLQYADGRIPGTVPLAPIKAFVDTYRTQIIEQIAQQPELAAASLVPSLVQAYAASKPGMLAKLMEEDHGLVNAIKSHALKGLQDNKQELDNHLRQHAGEKDFLSHLIAFVEPKIPAWIAETAKDNAGLAHVLRMHETAEGGKLPLLRQQLLPKAHQALQAVKAEMEAFDPRLLKLVTSPPLKSNDEFGEGWAQKVAAGDKGQGTFLLKQSQLKRQLDVLNKLADPREAIGTSALIEFIKYGASAPSGEEVFLSNQLRRFITAEKTALIDLAQATAIQQNYGDAGPVQAMRYVQEAISHGRRY